MGFFQKKLNKYADNFYVVFRIGIGLLFFLIGLQKITGIWAMQGVPTDWGTLIWFAGIFELMIGSALFFGVLTRLASFFGVIMMIVAYYLGHVVAGGWNPFINMGLPAIIFGLAFLVTFGYGAKKVSLEMKIWGKEIF